MDRGRCCGCEPCLRNVAACCRAAPHPDMNYSYCVALRNQRHRRPGPVVENRAAMENTSRAVAAYPIAAREQNDAAVDCRGNGRVAEHGEPGKRAYDQVRIAALKPRPSGGRKRENMALEEERALLARLARAASLRPDPRRQ
jgi:hypothetical protein